LVVSDPASPEPASQYDPCSQDDPSLRQFASAFAIAAPSLLDWVHGRIQGGPESRLLAEDLAQEIGLRAFRRYAEYDPARGNFRRWLIWFADQVWLDVCRVSFSEVPDPTSPDDPASQDDASLQQFASAFAAAAPSLLAWAHCRIRGDLRKRLEAEDLVQEVGMRACLRRGEYDPARGNFRQWLFGFANRVWLETLRELGRDPLGPRHRHGGDSQLPKVYDSVTTISRRVANDELLRACRVRLDALDDDDRRLLVAVGLEGLSHAEVGLLFGITEDTCRKRWQRLRERLQDDAVLGAMLMS
jgi:RNA polymerase sigma factor (sigma-70 family)